MTEPVSIGSSCFGGVAVLPCGSRLMQAMALETLNLNLTWRRNGLDFIPDSDSELVSHYIKVMGDSSPTHRHSP